MQRNVMLVRRRGPSPNFLMMAEQSEQSANTAVFDDDDDEASAPINIPPPGKKIWGDDCVVGRWNPLPEIIHGRNFI